MDLKELKKSLLSMTDEELQELHRKIRQSRQTVRFPNRQKKEPSEEKGKKKKILNSTERLLKDLDTKSMTPQQAQEFLDQLMKGKKS